MRHQPLILLVEDSPTQAQAIASVLQDYGCQVIFACDGIEGLQAVSQHQPDLVVLDINLPRLDGYHVCHRLKRDPRTAETPIIMLTAADSTRATMQGLKAGADDYIPKDIFATENLIVTLESLGIGGLTEKSRDTL